MTTQAAPVIPPRPSRSPQQSGLAPKSISDAPKIPPRPGKLADRSVSPLRGSYAPSPLNELPNAPGIARTVSHDLPQRPSSVTIPSLGEEGIEYQDLDIPNVSDNHSQIPTPAETRNVGSDLKIHAPRPSLPSSSAKAQVQAVTRLDSRQVAATGLGTAGSPVPDDQVERSSRSIHSRASGSRADSSTASTDRRRSFQLAEEHGIPEIGQRVPMYPNAGDVQAPSPSPYQSEHGGQRQGRNHHRTRSGRREASLPPGSYGLHGHGAPQDKFEKAWYEKHPEEYAKEEHGQYGPGVGTPRPAWALSSDDLNKIVRTSAVTGSGLGTSPGITGTPDDEVGYIASDEYTQRMATPAPESRRSSRLVAESPLRPANTTTLEDEKERNAHKPEAAGVIHVDDPYHPLHHPDGFASTPAPERGSREKGADDEEEDEPILAADEIRPESAFQHPAVSPSFERRTSDYDGRSRTPSINHSRSNSRSTSHQGTMPALVRYNSRNEREETHTPLNDVEEYEPLFPEDRKDEKPVSTADRFKRRPELSKHRFPSEDIWEDSPNSLQLHATVSTPDIAKQEAFETPEQESFRRSHTPHLDAHEVATNILESEERGGKTAIRRPDISKQRFPSRDIWEDAPESQKLVTTVEPSMESETKSPDVPSKPVIPSRTAKPPQQSPTAGVSSKPATSPTEKRQPPSIPDRPKPQIPARPAKIIPRGAVGKSQEAAAKEKPAVPVRPTGGKIAALKAGFLSDLNSRLQLGPQAPKPQEKKEEAAPAEKAPLSDARKGRARGPARRKPAAETVSTRLPTIPEIKITETWNVWQVGEDGSLTVETGVKTNPPETTTKDTMAPAISKNLAGESTDPSPMQEPALKTTEADETIPSTNGESVAVPAEAEPTTQESPQPAEAEGETSPETQSKITPSTTPPVDKAIEILAATADGKRLSEGSIQETD